MPREIVNAEDTCLIYHHDIAISIPPPLATRGRPQHVEKPALTGSKHSLPPPLPLNEKVEQTLESHGNAAANEAGTTDGDDDDEFPEGGARAWSVTVGSFCALFAVFGVINTTAVFQEYFSTHQLSGYSPSQIGWIFSLSLFLTFFCGNPIGPLFDAKGPRAMVFAGSVLLVLSLMLLGLCTSTYPSTFCAASSCLILICRRILALLLGVQRLERTRRLSLEHASNRIHRPFLPRQAGQCDWHSNDLG